MTVAAHPARFSDTILEVIAERADPLARVLDPFCGTGRIHEIFGYAVGVELEPEWATMHPHNIVGNALHLPFAAASFDTIVTSPCYGNRLADSHNAQEKCRKCVGTGTLPNGPCLACGGAGRRVYKRITYTHRLGRKLHPDNTGQLQWGEKYKVFHIRAWVECARVLRPGGTFILNVSDHIRKGERVYVSGWHTSILAGALPATRIETIPVVTPRMGFGQNRDARVDHEYVIVFTKEG